MLETIGWVPVGVGIVMLMFIGIGYLAVYCISRAAGDADRKAGGDGE